MFTAAVAAAVIDGGLDDDTLQGGSGYNTFVFADAIGRDNLTALEGSENEFVFTDTTESLVANIQNSGLAVLPSNTNQRIYGTARWQGRKAVLVPFEQKSAIVVINNHGLNVDDTLVLTDSTNPDWSGEFVVRSRSQNSVTIFPASPLPHLCRGEFTRHTALCFTMV
ncbi:MAG UNVERIFIED_CONTAM: hypothetical protein LVR18_14470 [Planctomycetaceae bacterium]